MKTIGILKNTVQPYAWGSCTAIPALLGESGPHDEPRAELWMGAHPKAPSMVQVDGEWMSLLKLVETHPNDILGEKVSKEFGGRLPFLFKVLAAEKPLSIQAHPNLEQAKEGYERENRLGIFLDAPHRNYRDANHKPECICALTPFWALNGFRKIPDMLSLFMKACPESLEKEIAALSKQADASGLKHFFFSLMTMSQVRQKEVIDETIEHANFFAGHDVRFQWVIRLYKAYPLDIGVLSPLLLNSICLAPGQAMFLHSGELHAYLEGVGIELMANSDNVLRGGLTPKHIDVKELMTVLNFEERSLNVLESKEKSETERIYTTPAEEFVLSVVALKKGQVHTSGEYRSVEILLCTDGKATLTDFGNKDTLTIKRGTSVIVPAAVTRYAIEGDATFYKAAVPD